MSNGESSVDGASGSSVGGSDSAVAVVGAMGNSGAQTQNPTHSNNGGSNNGGGAASGAPESGHGGGGAAGEKATSSQAKRQRRPPTAAQTAARKKAAEERKRFRDRVNLVAAALEEEQGRLQESASSTQQSTASTSNEAESGAGPASYSQQGGGEQGHEFDQGGDHSDGDEMDLVADAPQAPRHRSKREVYFGSRVRRTSGIRRVGNSFQQFLAGSSASNDGDEGSVRLPSASAMRQQFNWARAPGTSLLDRMAVMNNRANAHVNMRRSVRLPKYLDGL